MKCVDCFITPGLSLHPISSYDKKYYLHYHGSCVTTG